MRILLINRDKSKIRFPVEVINFYNLYLVAETSVYSSSLTEMVHLWMERATWSEVLIIEYYYGLYNDQNPAITKEEWYKMMAITKEFTMSKHKSKQDLILIQKQKKILNTMRSDVNRYFEWFFKGHGIFNWINLLNTDAAYTIEFSEYSVEAEKEDMMIPLIGKVLVENEFFFLFDGNIASYMKEYPLDENKTEPLPNCGECDFYSFPLFTIPYKDPGVNNNALTKETMIQIRKHLQEKITQVSDMMADFENEVRAAEFNKDTKTKVFEFFQSIKPAAALFQQHVDNEIYLQQIKNSSLNWYNVEWRVGVIKLAKIPEYFEKAKIILPFVAGALKNGLDRMLDTEKGELFIYCKVPDDVFKFIEDVYMGVIKR